MQIFRLYELGDNHNTTKRIENPRQRAWGGTVWNLFSDCNNLKEVKVDKRNLTFTKREKLKKKHIL